MLDDRPALYLVVSTKWTQKSLISQAFLDLDKISSTNQTGKSGYITDICCWNTYAGSVGCLSYQH
jgi:hypothetical protein